MTDHSQLMHVSCIAAGETNFCLNLHITHGDMKENVSGCFFSEHSVHTFSTKPCTNATCQQHQMSLIIYGLIGNID